MAEDSNVTTRDEPREERPMPEVLTEEVLTFPDGTRATRTDLEDEGGDAHEYRAAKAAQRAATEAATPEEGEEEEPGETEAAAEPEEAAAKTEETDDADEARREQRRQENRSRRQARKRREQETRERLEAAEKRLAELEGQKTEPKGDDAKPRMDDFEEPEEYFEAMLDWRDRQKAAPESEQPPQQAPPEPPEELHEFYAHGAARYGDFREVVGAQDLMITQHMAEFMFDSDVGSDVAYYLGQHKAEAAEIARMDDTAAIRALARLEAKVTQPAKADPPAKGAARPARKVTRASDPITPVSGGGDEAPKSPENMTQVEYNAWRTKQRRAQGLY